MLYLKWPILVFAYALISPAFAQTCCPDGCAPDANRCVTKGPPWTRCIPIACTPDSQRPSGEAAGRPEKHPAAAPTIGRLPAFDIARNCREETAGVGTSVEACTKDETDAKDQLAKKWSRFDASEKKTCVGMSSVGGGQSYVELLTCLEMAAGGQFSTKQ